MTRKSSFPPVAAADARLLVLGSLPGDRSLAEARYYAHPQNQFWALMSGVLARDLVALAYDERLVALRDAGVALWDVIGSAHRIGSTDAAILDAQVNLGPTLLPGVNQEIQFFRWPTPASAPRL